MFFRYLISFKSRHNFFFLLGKCRDQWYIVRLEVGYFLFLYKITSIILQLTFSLLMIYMSYFVYIHKYTSYTGGTTGKTSLHYWLVWLFWNVRSNLKPQEENWCLHLYDNCLSFYHSMSKTGYMTPWSQATLRELPYTHTKLATGETRCCKWLAVKGLIKMNHLCTDVNIQFKYGNSCHFYYLNLTVIYILKILVKVNYPV